jgi:ribosomal protein S18 acetylase RimI-like enzyme
VVVTPDDSSRPVFVLRPACEDDRAAMAAAQFAAYWSNIDLLSPGAHAAPGYRDRVADAAQADARDNWRKASVAEADGTVVAVCYIEPGPLLLEGLWVHPQLHGCGIGSALIEDALQRFRALEATQVIIEVHPQNPARRLYERHGFTFVKETTRWSVGLGRELPLLVLRREL